jgi:hypothetical protein
MKPMCVMVDMLAPDATSVKIVVALTALEGIVTVAPVDMRCHRIPEVV